MNKMRELRKALGLTQKELAEKAGITHAAINRYENGLRVPSVNIAIRIAHALGCTVEELVEGEPEAE